MERLTAYYGDCEEAYLSCERCGKTGIHECWTQEDCTQTAVDRLAAIEDILGGEYDLDELKEVVQAKREGRCVVLPCEVGSTVYMPFCDEVVEKRIGQFHVNGYTDPRIWADIDCDWATTQRVRWDLAFGKTVFLTRKEAQAALRREQDG